MKIVVNDKSAPLRSDKAETAMERAIEDLLFVQSHSKMYINEKKQLQSLIYKLYELNYYEKHFSYLEIYGKVEEE